MGTLPRRLRLVHGPTPLVKARALDERFGVDLWIKRDDAIAGAEAGNKLRKLEWLLADARAKNADVVLTCGGLQSNHARATALVAAQLGLSSVLFLRVDDDRAGDGLGPSPREALPAAGNVLLDRLVGAEIRLISAALYGERSALMEQAAAALRQAGRRPYVIPEGGSNGLGSLGYVEAMGEVRQQLDGGLGGGPAPFDVVVHACGSGGTAAGVALGAARHGVASLVMPFLVCDTIAYFEGAIRRIVAEARSLAPHLGDPQAMVLRDDARGPRYGVMNEEQVRFLVDVARTTGLLFDPVYTGKALYGVQRAAADGTLRPGARVLFLHTGGLPGLLAEGAALEAFL